jgi:hypothetical protein
MTAEEKEIEMLREAVEKSEKRIGYKIVQSELNKNTMAIVEEFIKRQKLVCYGGTAVNNILPKKAQFYNKNFELPDYDVFSPNAIADAKALTDIFFAQGFENVETRTAMNVGTYKVFVNFYAVADVTSLDPKLYQIFLKKGIKKDGIHYSPVNFLRMEMYKELSHPQGEIKRWEKVYKRLNLLNKYFPLHDKCPNGLHFMRDFKGNKYLEDKIYTTLKDILIKEEDVIFIGGYATNLYKNRLNAQAQEKDQIPDFDILATNAKKTAQEIKHKLNEKGIKHITLLKKEEVWKIVPVHYEIRIDNSTVCVVYETIACHSYNTVQEDNVQIKVASIDTMLNFLFAFLFKDSTYYDENRIMCMAQYLMQVQNKTKFKNKGLFKRFSVNCYGTQPTIETLRELKSEKFRTLKNKKTSSEYQKYFLRYNPLEDIEYKQKKMRKTAKKAIKRKAKENRTMKNRMIAKFINPLNLLYKK